MSLPPLQPLSSLLIRNFSVDAWESLLDTNKLVCGFCLIDRIIALDPSTSISRIFAASCMCQVPYLFHSSSLFYCVITFSLMSTSTAKSSLTHYECFWTLTHTWHTRFCAFFIIIFIIFSDFGRVSFDIILLIMCYMNSLSFIPMRPRYG